jgi:hypothetical protein
VLNGTPGRLPLIRMICSRGGRLTLILSRRGSQMDQLLNDSLIIFGSLAILLAPMALALAIGETRLGGGGWKLLTFLCCTVAAWFLFFAKTSGLVIALVAWLLAWACAVGMRMSFNRRRE